MSVLEEYEKKVNELQRKTTLKSILQYIINTVVEAVIGIVVSFILYKIIQNFIIPAIYEAAKSASSAIMQSKEYFGIKEIIEGKDSSISACLIRVLNTFKVSTIWYMIFGLRFAVGYITKGVIK